MTLNTSNIDRFFKRYHTAVLAKNKELTMSMENATALAGEIEQLLTKLLEKQDKMLDDNSIIEIVVDGGHV